MYLICTDTHRARAYLQTMVQLGRKISRIFLLVSSRTAKNLAAGNFEMFIQSTKDLYQIPDVGPQIDFGESVITTASQNGIELIWVEAKSVNSEKLISTVKRFEKEKCIYACFSGEKVNTEVLDLFDGLTHAHPGMLPEMRGSTTFFYSLILEKSITVTVFNMVASLDRGDPLHVETFNFDNLDVSKLENYVDPYLRAVAMGNSFVYPSLGIEHEHEKSRCKSRELYVAHPIVRRLVRKKLEKNISK